MRALVLVVSAGIVCQALAGEPDNITNVRGGQISEEQAIRQLMAWLKSHPSYYSQVDCLKPKSLGYRNAGYTIELVAESCPGNQKTRLKGVVGRWRVDAKTAEIYVQNEAGKYVSPRWLTYNQNPVADTGMRVPFVGCKSDGQVGPLEAPKSAETDIRLDAKVARRLVLYKAESGPAVLGPVGWSCFGRYGSGGSTLYVAPEPLKPADMFNSKWEGITGFGIEASFSIGETSGRMTVAKIVARVFPEQRSFVESVIAMGFLPASDFPFGPFPADRLTYLNERVVEFETPPGSEGLGTYGELRPTSNSIRGVAICLLTPEAEKGNDVSLLRLALRLPQNMKDLVPTIIKEFEAREDRTAILRERTGN